MPDASPDVVASQAGYRWRCRCCGAVSVQTFAHLAAVLPALFLQHVEGCPAYRAHLRVVWEAVAEAEAREP